MWEIRGGEFARNGKDQTGLNSAGRLQRWIVEKIGKRQTGNGVLKRRHRGLYRIACKIDPFQKVSDLISPNAECDLQHFQTADFLAERGVETRSALFDVSEVESRYVRDRLDVVVTGKVGVGSALEILVVSGDGGNIIELESLRESGAKVWIGRTEVAHEPAG